MPRQAAIAKISTPRLFGVVARQRLFARLDENRGRPLIWIDGPPGAGKTTLIASYLEARGTPTLWYQVEPGDADPANLFHYLALAAEQFPMVDAPALPRLVPEHLSDLPSFARLFFRAFFARLPERLILVLDNYQEAPEDALLHEILRHAVAEVRPDSSVIAISRVQAPRNFVQLVAQGAMTEVGWDNLQLTLDEVRDIAAKRSVTDDWLLKALHQQSQGWAAGITLMLERLGHFDGKGQELPTETRESVFNYFASLIFDQASEKTRHILLSIAFLPQVTPSLARELSGRTDAPALLEDLYRRRMFTDRRPGTEPVYQFHALFLDFLRVRARAMLVAEELERLLRRSACALENTGDFDAAMDLWLAAQSWGEAIRLVLREANSLLDSGRRQTLMLWIQEIPGSARANEPWLIYWLGRAQMQTSPAEGVRTLEHALDLFKEGDDRQGRIECLAALLGGAFLGFRAFDAMDRWLDILLTEIDPLPKFETVEMELRIWSVLCMSLFHVRPWHPWMVRAYRKTEQLLLHGADANVALTATMGPLVVSGLTGDFERGDRIVVVTERFASQDTASPSEAAWWFAQAGWLRFMEARYEEAIDYLTRGSRIAESQGLNGVRRQIVLWRFTVEYRSVGWSVANATLAELEAMQDASQPMPTAQLYLYKARRACYRGQKEEAGNFAAVSTQTVTRIGSLLQEVVFGLSNADVFLDAMRIDDAKALLARVRALIERTPVYLCFHSAVLFMEARCLQLEGERALALVSLRESLELAHEGNSRCYLRFSDRAMPPLFRLALEENIETDLVRDVIRTFRLRVPQDAPDLWPWPVRIFTLGRFEVQIHGERMEFSRKLPRKTLLLLKAIVAHGGRDIGGQTLCDALWGDEEGDAARNALSITILRLRKLLGSNEAIFHLGGKVSLNPDLCWVDTWMFEARIAETESADRRALSLYSGNFLPEDEDESWSVAARERLRGKFIHALSAQAVALESQGDVSAALQSYLRGIEADPIVESFHQGLMRCYERMGKRSEAFSAYRRLKHTLSVLLGVPPSDATQRLFQDMLQRQSEGGALPGSDSAIPSASKAKREVVARLPLPRAR